METHVKSLCERPSVNTSPRQRNQRGQGARLREELIEAASGLLAEWGDPEQVSIRAVASAAGVTPPSIYLHFADRKSLLRAVVATRFGDFGRQLSGAEAAGKDPYDALRRRCRAYFAFGREHPGHYRVLFSAAALGPKGIGTYGKTDHPGASSFIALVDAVQRCLDAGARPGGGRDSFFLAIQLWAWMHGLIDLRISKPEMPWPAVVALLDATLSDLGLDDSEKSDS
jgi:AcrR family transcriptional regulator